MTGYLARLRADFFDDTMRSWERSGITPDTHPDEYRGLAEWANVATGRGSLGKLEEHADKLGGLLASPKLLASRAQVINPYTYMKQSPAVRRIAVRDILAFAGTGAALLTLAANAPKGSGISAVADPRSSDFGKVVIGNTRLDLSAGISPYLRLIAQVSTGKRVSSSGKEKDAPPLETVAHFGRSRLGPLSSLIVDGALGTTFDGKETSMKDETLKRFYPLFIADAKEVIEEQGAVPGALLGLAAFLGAGVQTYKDDEHKATPSRARRPSPRTLAEARAARGSGKDTTTRTRRTMIEARAVQGN